MYEKSKGIKNTSHECNPMSIKNVGKSLGSSSNTVNPFSIRESGKSLKKGK